MTEQKSFKRLVRARMEKTGESYTTARARLLRADGVLTIGVPVSDQDRALSFYRDRLGLEALRDVALPQLGGRWIEVAPAGQSVSIALAPTREGVPTGVHTGIRLKVTDAGAVHAELEARGVEVGEMLRWPGVPPMFGLRDQDGNRLEIVDAA